MNVSTKQRIPPLSVTTDAVRDFIKAGGRILVTPSGELTEGGGMPRSYTHGSPAAAAEYLRAGKAYSAARMVVAADFQIMRAVRLLGRRTENGWLALEALPSSNRKRGPN